MAKIDEQVKVMMLKGETGSNIASIKKTATSGLVDTYTVSLTDGTKSSFTVTNGKDGKDGVGFDTFEIGGRNLLRGSRDFSYAAALSSKATKSTDTVGGVDCTVLSADNSAGSGNLDPITLELPGIGTAGAVYTLSFWFKGTGECTVYFSGPEGYTQVSRAVATINGNVITSESQDGRVTFIARGSTVTNWTRCTVVYTLKSTVGSTTKKSILWRVAAGATLFFALPMLERSTKPSDWTPAPEDKADASIQNQIVPSAAVESSATASQAYAAGDYVVVNGVLRKVKSAIAKGNAISDSNSTSTTVIGELATVSQIEGWFIFDIDGVKLAIKTITESVSVASPYTSDIYYGNFHAASLPSGVFANAPACSASIVNASATCWIASLSDSAPTKDETQRFRLLSSSNETINASIMITAIGA